MKKLLTSAAAAMLLAGAAASSAQAQSIRFGVKAGANLSNLAGDLTGKGQYDNRFGFHGGVMLNFGLANDLVSIQPELLYSQKGFKYSDQAFGIYRNTGSVRYDYLDVPVLVRVKVSGVFFELGPQYSYLMNIASNRTQSLGGITVNSGGSSNLASVNRNELGYVGGIGFQSSQGVLLGVRYNGAFTDFAKDGYSNNDFRNARNSAFQAYVGVLLGGK